MFKLESYITPFIMGYIDKYVKLKQEDFQLSLWGGDAVLNKLDLRLEAIEQALQVPITFKSGHIHELRIHVPWTKLGSEPVVITINTIECVVKLRDATEDDHSTSSNATVVKTSQPKVKLKRPQDAIDEDLPPGYLQGYIKKIINNVNIVINNLILKFVEDDIVLSVNVKSAEMYSVNHNWERAFIELMQPELVLRRVINVHDLTVCLDKRNASGKIDTYQDPLMYRCSLTCRMHMTYDGLHVKYPSVTKFNVLCDKLELSLTDVQVPMYFRLIELVLAIYYGTLDLPGLSTSTEETPKVPEIRSNLQIEPNIGATDRPPDDTQGWGSWAWSYVPQILPQDEDEDWVEGERRPKKKEAAIYQVGMYCRKACVVFKLSESLHDHSRFGPHKTSFKPCMRWEAEGISVDVLLKGIEFFNVQFGITNSSIYSEGLAVCGVNDIEDSTRDPCFFRSGQIQENKPVHFLSYSLFDPESAENQGDRPAFIVSQEKHMELYTETYGIQKFGSIFMDYCYVMEKERSDEDQADDDSVASFTEEGEILGAKENSVMRFIVGPAHLVVSSSMFQRVHKFIHCAGDHEYEPYSKPKKDTPPATRSPPSDEDVKRMEEYIPTRTQHFTLLRPSLLIQANDLPEYDVTKKRVISHRKATKKKKDSSLSHFTTPPLPGVLLQADRFDLQVTTAMFPKRLVRSVSSMTAPSDDLLHHCHKHLYIKLFGLQTGLTMVNDKSQMTALQNVTKPCSGAFYKTVLLLPKYWKNPLQTKSVVMYEIPQVGVQFTKSQVMLLWYTAMTWTHKQPNPGKILETSLLSDVFYPQLRPEVKQPVLECVVSSIELKQCYTEATTSMTGTLASFDLLLHSAENSKAVVTPILHGPTETSKIHKSEFLFSETSVPADNHVDLVMFTVQVPTTPNRPQAPGAVFIDLQGIVGSLDPLLNDWLQYTTVMKGYTSVHLSQQIDEATEQEEGGDTQIQAEASDSASNQTNPTSGQTTSISQSYSMSKSQPLTSQKEDTDGQKEEQLDNGLKDGESLWGAWFAEMFPLIKIMEVQVDVQSMCLLFPTYSCTVPQGNEYNTGDLPSMNITTNMKQLFVAKKLPDTLVMCLPSARVYSQGHKCLPPVQELPIKVLEHSIAGEKLPWSVEIKNGCIYSIHNKDKIHYIVDPTCIESTIAVTPVYNPPTSDTITSLGLALHADIKEMVVGLSNEQVQLTYDLIKKELEVVSKLRDSLCFIQKYLNPPIDGSSSCNVSTCQLNTSTTVTTNQKQSSSFMETRSKKQSIPSESSHIEITDPMGGVLDQEMAVAATDTSDTESGFSRMGSPMPEDGTRKVKLSFWMQWTVLKFVLKLYSRFDKEIKIETEVEDVSTSVDIGSVYTKVNSKIGSLSVLHFTKISAVSPWQSGSFEGIILTKSDIITRNTNIIGNRSWCKLSDQNSAEFELENVKPKEKGHSFMTFTFTRASKKSVKKKLQMMDEYDRLMVPESKAEKKIKESKSRTYINEVVLNFLPCDIVLNCPVFIGVINVFKIDTRITHDHGFEFLKDLSINSEEPSPDVKSQNGAEKSDVPYCTSANVPLLYINSNGVRILIPNIPEKQDTMERESSLLTLNDSAIASFDKEIPQSPSMHTPHDQAPVEEEPVIIKPPAEAPAPLISEVTKGSQSKRVKPSESKIEDIFIIEMVSFSINPQPMNPLPRNIVNKDMYRKAIHSEILNVPGSDLEDRQYQLDVCGWSLSSGNWNKLIKHLEEKQDNTEIQNPALEWNNMIRKRESEAIQLIPLASSFDLRITAAPAIVYYPQDTLTKPTLVCGYSLEMNATSDLDFYMSLNQVQLAHKIFLSNAYPLIWSITSASSEEKNNITSNIDTESSNRKNVFVDSSKNSTLSSQTSYVQSKQNVMETIHEDNVNIADVTFELEDTTDVSSCADFGHNDSNFTPFDVLLTAGRISMMVYRHADVEQLRKSRNNSGSVAKKKSDLEWRSSIGSDIGAAYYKQQGKSQKSNTDDNSTLDSGLPEKDVTTRKKIVPVLYAYFSQPHSLISVLKKRQKIELSCYDLVLKGGKIGGGFIKDDSRVIPEPSDFSTHWIETKPGKPDSKTGIPPSLYTFRLTDFLLSPARIMLNIERPVKMNLSLSNIEQIVQVSEEVWIDMRDSFRSRNNNDGTNLNAFEPEKETTEESPKSEDSLSKDNSRTGLEDGMMQVSKALTKVGDVEFHTVQILMVLEAAVKNNSPKIELSTSAVDAQFNFIPKPNKALTSEIDGQVMVKDVYMTTSLLGKSRPLIGPFTSHVIGNASWCQHSGSRHLPKVLLSVKTGVVEVYLGQSHVLCLLELGDHFKKLIEKTVSKWHVESPPSSKTPEKRPTRMRRSKRKFPEKIHVSKDDLRSGSLEYVALETNIEELPNEGEILFSNNFQKGQAGVSWSYRQPRVITHLCSTPMPLNLPLEMEARRVNEDLVVPCLLQYWDSLTSRYENYAQFTVSEHKSCDVDLPDVTNENREDVVASKIWRVLIVRPEERQNKDGYVLLDKQSEAGSVTSEDDEFVVVNKQDNRFIEPLVSPLTLAASLKVTSCFAQHLVPMVQTALIGEQIQVHLSNHMDHVGKSAPGKLQPFEVIEPSVADQEFMVLKIDNPSFTFNAYQGQEECVECEVSSELSADVLEYRNLTMIPMIDRVEVDGEIQWTKRGDRQKVKTNIFVEPFVIKTGPSVIHTLNMAASCWQQLNSKDDYPVAHHFILCNDTQETIRVGQVDTDEGLIIKSRQALPYAWRTHRDKQMLRICLERLAWQWCEPVSLETDNTFVRTIAKNEHSLTLIIQIKQLTNVQKQVTVRGNYILTSRVTHPLDIKLLTTRGSDKILTLPSEGTLPSYVLDTQEVKALKIRLANQNVLWSQEITITGELMKTSKMLKIPSQECTSFMHVWCHLFEQNHNRYRQNVILLAPLFVFRSQLPAPLLMTVDTPRIKIYSPLEVEGHNMDTQIHTMGGDMTHNITFQLSHNMKPSKPAIQLSSGMIEQVSTEKLDKVDVSKVAYDWKDPDSLYWPYNDPEYTGTHPITQPSTVGLSTPSGKTRQETTLSQQHVGGHVITKPVRDTTRFWEPPTTESQPNIDLQVSLSQYWPGCNTLLVDIAPHLLLCNHCDLDLWVIANGETHWKLPAEQTWAPPPFEGSFRLGLVIDHELQLCDQLELSQEDDRARYLPKIEGLLYMEGHINVSIPIKGNDGGRITKMCYLTLHSTKQKNMRILTVKERFAISNHTSKDLYLTAADVNLSQNKVTIDFEQASVVSLPSRNSSENIVDIPGSNALLFWDVLQPTNHTDYEETLNSNIIEHVQYILLQSNNNDSAFSNKDVSCDGSIKRTRSTSISDQSTTTVIRNPLLWSCPIRMKLNASANRQNVSIPDVNIKGKIGSYMCTSVAESKDEVTYIVVSEEYNPQLVVQNNCDFSLHFGQTYAEKSIEDATVYEEVELINKLPILPPKGSTQYTFPSLNSQFSELAEYDKTSLKLHFSACHDLNEQFSNFYGLNKETVIGDCSVLQSQSSVSAIKTDNCCHRNQLMWSQGVDVCQGSDCCIYVPGLSDVKIHIEKVGHTTYLYLDQVTRAEISAKEIRSRIKGEEKTVIIEATQTKEKSFISSKEKKDMKPSVIDFEQQAEIIGDSLNCTNTRHGVLVNVSESLEQEKRNSLGGGNGGRRKRSSSSGMTLHTPVEVECNLLCKQGSFVLLDEQNDEICEALRVTIDNAYLFIYPKTDILQLTYQRQHSSYRAIAFIGDMQIDNMMQKRGNFDYPVVLIRKENVLKESKLEKDFVELTKDDKVEVLTSKGFLCVDIGLCSDAGKRYLSAETLALKVAPLKLFVEDTFIYEILKRVEQLMPIKLTPVSKKKITRKIPNSVSIHQYLQPIRLQKLMIEPIRMDLSVHASLKLFLASDNSPLKFGRFEKSDMFVSGSQLARIITMHYASAALFRAGWVVGSLELIGSPTGLVRSIGTGVSDLFKMPYEGLTIGPGAFVGGVTRGLGSLLKNVSSGTLTSITNFASSVSRNMDRLSLDAEHQQRQELYRRQKPSGVSEGLVHGLTGFGLSVLGAVAGLADQPLQTFTRDNKSASTTGLVSGVGKGLVGIVTKPVGGAAEFVSQTGIGLLQGTGLVKYPSPRVTGLHWKIATLQNGRHKIMEKILHNTNTSDVIGILPASQNLQGNESTSWLPPPCMLILTTETLFIIDSVEDCQQQAFMISEVDCTKSKTKGSIMYVAVKSAVADPIPHLEEKANQSDERIQAFVKNVSKNALGGDFISVSDNQSETSNTLMSQSGGFMYEFTVDRKLRDVFVTLFTMCKSRIGGSGFIV